MQVVHVPRSDGDAAESGEQSGADADARVLATDVEVAETLLEKGRGLMFRRSIPVDYAMVFEFDGATRRNVHALFVPEPIDVVFLDGERVERVATLSPWTGFASHRADRLVEVRAGVADAVSPGDRIVVE